MLAFINNIKTTLQEDFPFTMGFKNEFFSFLKSTLALIIVLYVIGFFNPKQNVFLFFLGFFLSFFIVFTFNYFFNTIIISKIIKEENWCLWKELFRRFFFLGMYSFAIILYVDYYLYVNLSKADFWQFVTASFIVGSIPITLKIFITKNKLLKISLTEASLLQERIGLYQSESKKVAEEVVIQSNIINEVFKVNMHDIVYLKSDQNYISIFYIKDGELKSHLLRISLVNALKQITSEHIFRCHRSYVVNINCIENISGNAQSLKLELTKNCIVPVSRSFIKEFKKRLVN